MTTSPSEHFIVCERLWSAVGLRENDGTLCLGCFEGILGRELRPDDFPAVRANEPHALLTSPRLVERMGYVFVDDAGDALAEPPPEPEPSFEYLGPVPDGTDWFGAVEVAGRLSVTLPTLLRLAKDRQINAAWHPLRFRRDDIEVYEGLGEPMSVTAAGMRLGDVTGATGELVDRFLLLVEHPPIPDPLRCWTREWA